MNIEIKLTGLDGLVEALHAIAAAMSPAPVAKAPAAKKALPAPVELLPVPSVSVEVTSAPTPAIVAEAVAGPSLFEQAKTLVLEISKTKGRDAAAAILATFGAKKLGEVAEADLPALIKAAS